MTVKNYFVSDMSWLPYLDTIELPIRTQSFVVVADADLLHVANTVTIDRELILLAVLEELCILH